MDRLYLFFIRNDVWIYIVSVLGLIWYLVELYRSSRILRRAVFNLERETGTQARNHALGFVLLFATLIGVVYYVNTRVAPNLPPELLFPPTPTPNVFATPLSSPTPLGEALTEDGPPPTPAALAPTVTLPGAAPPPGETAGEAVGETATPEPVPTAFVGCTDALNITAPRDGAAVGGDLTLSGTANTGQGHTYTLETNGPQTAGDWAPLLTEPQPQPVFEDVLGRANLVEWTSGPYLIRLLARNSAGNDIGQCVIQITLDAR
jgi:hypothetical protein